MSEAGERRIPIFDGHNDTVLSLRGTGRSFFTRTDEGHIDLPRARAGGLAGGIFAVFVPSPEQDIPRDDPGAAADIAVAEAVKDPAPEETPSDSEKDAAAQGDAGVIPPPPGLTHEYALRFAMAEVARLLRIEAQSRGQVRIVHNASGIRACIEGGAFAIQLHFEGAEAIDTELTALDVFHAAGLRSLGIVWSRSNAFGHGVPFGMGSPDTGPGLTDAGKDLARACNRLRIMLDLSHLNEKGFWDVAKISDAPLVASHSNAHTLSPATRNLTDRQLAAIRESDGLVGLNFHVGFLRQDGARDVNTPLEVMADHVDYLVEHVGIDGVGLGSDFDGATMPAELGDVTGLPVLMETLRGRGYDDAALRKIGHENWIRVLERTWG
ncbi:MAG TPA: dipeptidase, partial [Thermomicrobiales bacterium]|nr:dipeptidase [Thermomicrobiales bacterium]